jgi:hypothetical protein
MECECESWEASEFSPVVDRHIVLFRLSPSPWVQHGFNPPHHFSISFSSPPLAFWCVGVICDCAGSALIRSGRGCMCLVSPELESIEACVIAEEVLIAGQPWNRPAHALVYRQHPTRIRAKFQATTCGQGKSRGREPRPCSSWRKPPEDHKRRRRQITHLRRIHLHLLIRAIFPSTP